MNFDQQAIQQAFDLAASVQGTTSPNPPVGAVVIRAGQVVGFGATQPPGGPHAERVALAMAGADAYGADLYVTLEPCTFQGRTPACTDAIIAAGIARVYFVFRDGDPACPPTVRNLFSLPTASRSSKSRHPTRVTHSPLRRFGGVYNTNAHL